MKDDVISALRWCKKNPGKEARRFDDEEYFVYFLKYENGRFYIMKGLSKWIEMPVLKGGWTFGL